MYRRFQIKGDAEKADKLINNLKLIIPSSKYLVMPSLIIHPAATTPNLLSPSEKLAWAFLRSLLRISVGIEHLEDIKADIEQNIKAL